MATMPRPVPGVAPGMAAAKAPPFRLPGEHFAAALAFLSFGAAGVIHVAPDLATGAFVSPRVAAVTHMFTLGWITTSIMGALYQFLPVALGEAVRSVRLAHLTFALYAPGLAAFAVGLLTFRPGLLLAGAATFGTALLLFVWNLGATLARSRQRDVTWWALAAADVFLAVTVLIGIALAANLRWGYFADTRLTVIGTHLHVALAGWVLLVVIGVGQRLLPMFLLSHGVGDRWARAAVALVAAGAGVLTLLHHAPVPFGRWLPAVLVGSGLACFLVQARQFYLHRHRPTLDPGMRLAGAALALLGAGAVLGAPVVTMGASPRLATAYVLTVILAISLFVAAHYYKIVPFLVWYHRFGPLAGKRPVPRVADLYSARVASMAGALLAIGAAVVGAGVLAGSANVVTTGAWTFGAGALVESAQMLLLARRRP